MEAVNARTEVIRRRLKGISPEMVAEDLGLSVVEVNSFFRSFLTTNYSDLGEVELRLTQLARLDSMISMLWDTVQAGDTFTEGRQTANMLKVIEELNKLMGLHRDPLREAQVQLTKAQTELVHLVMTEMRGQMLTKVQAGVREIADRESLDETAREQLSIQVDSSWSKWYAEAYAVAVKSVREIEEAHDG